MKLLLINILLIILPGIITAQNLSLWEKQTSNVSQPLNKLFFIDSTRGWAAGDSGTILRTENGGKDWFVLHGSPDTYILDMFFFENNTGWVLYWDNIPPVASKFLKTTDGGTTWDTASCPGENPFFNSIWFTDSLTGYLAGPPILKTTDGGETWYETYVYDVDTLPPDLSGLPMKHLEFANKNIGYVCGGFQDVAGVIWSTTDGGESWGAEGVTIDKIFDFHLTDSLNLSLLAGDPEGYFHLIYNHTTDGGRSWSSTELNTFGISSALSFRTLSEGWGLLANEFVVTTDSGNSWTEYYTPDSLYFEDLVFTDTSTGYAVGQYGTILKFKMPGLTGLDNDITKIPEDYFLAQNYPNPFNPVTVIEYGILKTGKIELTVYDPLGNKISTLFTGSLPPGHYRAEFDGSDLASGVYLALMKFEGGFRAIKMILLR